MTAEIVILSFADSELAALSAAAAELGPAALGVGVQSLAALDQPAAVDAFIDNVASHAGIIVVRAMGGAGYWRYGLERLRAMARAKGSALMVVPGEARWDPALETHSTAPAHECRRAWRYLVEGGHENCRRALAYLASLLGRAAEPLPPLVLPRAGFYVPGVGAVDAEKALSHVHPDKPLAALVFYRALIDGGMTAPVDALAAALEGEGLGVLPVFVASLKEPGCEALLREAFAVSPPAIVLNATAFAVSHIGETGEGTVLDAPGGPVLQVILGGSTEEAWREDKRGLSPQDLTMNVAMPEIDGRIVTRAISFKAARDDARPGATHQPVPDRVAFVARQARAWVTLAETPIPRRRIALVLGNYPDRDGRIGNGVGLDTPASTVAISAAMRDAGYEVGAFPETGAEMMEALRFEAAKPSTAILSLADYAALFATLPAASQAQVNARWASPTDDPLVADGAFHLRAIVFGNVALAVQPARGYGIDPADSRHDPDLVPPHHYLAFYAWLRRSFGAQAIVHVGKHGNLEWLPGKGLALSAECWPEIALGATPLIYPFIVNDPGEGSAAKRRASAVIVDHLMPPMTRAGVYGELAALETLVDEYALAAPVDPRRAAYLWEAILEGAARHGLDRDLGITRADRDGAVTVLDAHLCDLKEMQIRDGLHVLGASPIGAQRSDTLVATARTPRSGGRSTDASLHRAIADDLGLGFDPMGPDLAAPWRGPRPAALAALSDAPWRSAGDTIERIEALAARLVSEKAAAAVAPLPGGERASRLESVSEPGAKGVGAPDPFGEVEPPHPSPLGSRRARQTAKPSPRWGEGKDVMAAVAREVPVGPRTTAVLCWIVGSLAPALDGSGNAEIAAVLAALDGRFVRPGPSGAPTRGRADVLPTGRNFYSVDVRGVPTAAAFALGKIAADALAQRYLADEGRWPRSIAMSAWATSNMRTGGDDIAEVLGLIGAEPTWEPGTGRVTGFRVVPLAELGRPRIDVTLKISGMFRDAFPGAIALINDAVRAIAALEEPHDMNPIAGCERAGGSGPSIFGSKPGAYGTGLQAPIDEGDWTTRADLAEAFLAWGGFAYDGGEGMPARDAFAARLASADAVFQAQDNREHDVLDSDDYYQFMGGLAATVETIKGTAPRIYFGDHARPERPLVRGLSEEIARVVRGRAANPKWIAGMMRHGYKGAFEIAATVDYLFAFAATTDAVASHHFDALYDAYVADAAVADFMADANPAALGEMAARFREAIDRGLWSPLSNSAYDRLSVLVGERKVAAE